MGSPIAAAAALQAAGQAGKPVRRQECLPHPAATFIRDRTLGEMATADEERAKRIEELVRQVEQIPDPESRECAQKAMEAILELHGAGLERMMELVLEGGASGEAAIRRFTNDSLVSSLLILHDLHPDDVETRIAEALRRMRANAELVGVFEGTVRVRLSGEGCGLKETVEAAIRAIAPEVTEVFIDVRPPQGFVPLAALGMAIPGAV
jgi:hypothetical protein